MGADVPTLHIHMDEAGNSEFSPKGTKYFVLAATWTYDPRPLAHRLLALRFELVRSGVNIPFFHAAPDKQATRDLVVKALLAEPHWQFAGVVLEKCKVNPTIRDPQRFYPKFAGTLLRFILRGRLQTGTTRVLVFTDTLPLDTTAKREGVIKAIRQTCSAELPPGVPYHVFSHPSSSNKWLQVTDYCTWALCRKWERGDTKTYNQLRPKLAAPELDVTARGDNTRYY